MTTIGNLTGSVTTLFDNGVLSEEFDYNKGLKDYSVQDILYLQSDRTIDIRPDYVTYKEEERSKDLRDAFDWNERKSLYDASGQKILETTIYDDGVNEIVFHFNGKPVMIGAEDKDNAHDWLSYSQYVRDGRVSYEARIFDDGVQMTSEYRSSGDNFVISKVKAYDGQYGQIFNSRDLSPSGSHDWFSYEQSYDSEGNLSEETRIFDNGGIFQAIYRDGKPRAISQTDGLNKDSPYISGTGSKGAHVWFSYGLSYDLEGKLVLEYWVYDNGISTQSLHGTIDGQEKSVTRVTDGFSYRDDGKGVIGIYSWREKRFQTLDDELIQMRVINDDGVIINTDFEDGIKRKSVVRDREDAHDWKSYTDSFDKNGDFVKRKYVWDDGTTSIDKDVEDVNFTSDSLDFI